MIINTNIDNKIIDNKISDDKICLICLESDGILILCSKCKYKYCIDCANKVNNLCSVCIRTGKLRSSNYMNQNFDINDYSYIYNNTYDYSYIYDNMDDYDIDSLHGTSYFFTLTLSIGINIIIGFCWIILMLFFGFIGLKFLLHIFSIMQN